LILMAPAFAGTPGALRALGLVASVLAVTCVLSVSSHRFVELGSIRAGNWICGQIARRAGGSATPTPLTA
jgi:hypothetical protein